MKNRIVLFTFGLILLFGIFYFFSAPTYKGQFEATDASGLIPVKLIQDFSGILSVNLDDDADPEILIAAASGKNRMLKLVDHRFVELSIPELSDEAGNNFSISACDLDHDGRDEILFINHPTKSKPASSQVYKFSDKRWSAILKSDDPLISMLDQGHAATCVDRRGNGIFGLAVSVENGHPVFVEEKAGALRDISSEVGLTQFAKGRSILGVPGGSGLPNLFQGNEDGANFYYVNDGKGIFHERAEASGLADATFDARGATLIDENHDELPDLIYGNHFGPSRLMRQKRDGTFEDVTPLIMEKAYAINSLVAQDLNLDSEEDLYGNIIRGKNTIFSSFGSEWFSLSIPLLEEKDMYGIATLVGDLDGVPGIEIMNTHGDGAEFPITLYKIKPVGDWLKIHLRSKNGGILRGSTVLLKTSKRNYVRVQSPGTGRYGESHTDLVFGLKKDEALIAVEILTPAGQQHRITEKLEKNSVLDIQI